MELKTMYSGVVNSPTTKLNQDIGPTNTIIYVENLDVFPPAPNLAVIGIDESAETIRYAAIDTAASTLTGCTRALEGVAKDWPSTTPIARNFTNYDYNTLRENVSGVNDSAAAAQATADGAVVKADAAQNTADTAQTTAEAALPKSGGTMTGALTLSGAPTSNLHAATKAYVDAETAKRLPLTGGTMTGAITLSGTPTSDLHAATKKYVDGKAVVVSQSYSGTSSSAMSGTAVKQAFASEYVTAGQKSGTTLGNKATAEGSNTTASGYCSHAEGFGVMASGNQSHAEGMYTTASGRYSHVEGYYTIAHDRSECVIGQYNVESTGNSTEYYRTNKAFVIGNGTSLDARSNAMSVDFGGNMTLAGNLTLSGAPTADLHAATKKYVDDKSVLTSDDVTFEQVVPETDVDAPLSTAPNTTTTVIQALNRIQNILGAFGNYRSMITETEIRSIYIPTNFATQADLDALTARVAALEAKVK